MLRQVGFMGAEVDTNWSQTFLGLWAKWAQSLKTVIGILVDSCYPSLVWWGQAIAAEFQQQPKRVKLEQVGNLIANLIRRFKIGATLANLTCPNQNCELLYVEEREACE
jgi:hypothetical protein